MYLYIRKLIYYLIYFNSSEDITLSKSFVYEKSDNDNVKKIINSFITLNGYEAWFHKCKYYIFKSHKI